MPTNTNVIKAGLYSTMVSCGPFDQSQVSTCDYGVVERATGCALIIHYLDEEADEITYRGKGLTVTEFITMRFQGEGYIQFTGDSQKFLANVTQLRDDIKSTIRKDTSLQSSACFAWAQSFSYNIDEGYEMGGKDWGILRFIVTIKDL